MSADPRVRPIQWPEFSSLKIGDSVMLRRGTNNETLRDGIVVAPPDIAFETQRYVHVDGETIGFHMDAKEQATASRVFDHSIWLMLVTVESPPDEGKR